MSRRPLLLLALLAILLVTAAPVLGFTHATVTHTHTHAHDTALHIEIYDSLAGALVRQDLLAALLSAFSLAALGIVMLPLFVPMYATLRERRDYSMLDALRKGRVKYRTFG